MRSPRLLAAAAIASIVALSGCDKARPLPAPADPTQGCLSCHGGEENQTGAPPLSLPRNAAGVIQSGGNQFSSSAANTQIEVGAHTRHLSRGVSCGACHVVPVMISSPGHNTGQRATVAFKELAAAGNVIPAPWDPTPRTCTNYCHGSATGWPWGGNQHTPDWLGGVTGSCLTCHFGPGQVPPSQHPQGIGGAGFATARDCAVCHTETVNASTGEINVTGGKHVNGQLDGGGGHPPGWADPANHGPAANAGLQACAVCHGSDFDGGTSSVSCNACHATNGHPSWQTECTFCHGSPTRAANPAFPNAGNPAVRANLASPPVGSQGETNTTAYAVGAHDSHVSGSSLASATQCLQCHGPALPANVAHVNGTVTMAWGPIASASNTTPAPAAGNLPRWNDATLPANGANCTNYCHGASLDGGTNTSPKWNEGAAGAFCGSCHGVPPPYTAKGKWHVPRSDCATCHPGYSGSAVVAATHVDGVANLGSLNCTSCHGSATNAAPPSDITGAASGGNAIGAHQKHVAGVTIHQGNFACSECHPNVTTTLHANGSINILWGATAAAGGYAVVPANGGFPRGTAFPTCTVYCHNPNNADTAATNKAPSWTGAPSTVTCGSCHGLPPQGTGHTTSTTCSGCHQGYADAPNAASIASAVSLVNHINGVTDLAGGGSLTCTSCHGTSGRASVATADPLQAVAPPVAATGPSAVGAHLAHVNQGATAPPLSNALRCINCHNPIPSTIPHGPPYPANPVAFGNLATAASAAPPPYAQATQTCSNTYCHGQFSGGTTGNSITWGAAGKLACTACHGQGAGVAQPTYPHPQNTTCASCHTGSTATTVAAATHVDGLVTKSTFGCSACHGVLTTANPGVPAATPLNSAPGAGGIGLATTGAPVAATTPEYGAHQAHLQQTTYRSASLACADCHVVPAAGTVAHATGVGTGGARATMTWSALARGAVNTVWTTAVTPSYSRTGSVGCTATYCHGNFTNGKGAITVVWAQNAALDCNSCHGAGTGATATLPGGTHPQGNTACGTCHTGYTGTTVAAATHIDGSYQVVPQACTGCHATAQGTRRAIVPEFAQAWSHKRSAGGTVTNFDCAVCHMEGDPATGNPVAGVHQNGVINLRDPDTGNNIQGVTFGGAGAGAYTSSGTNMTFTRFSRDLGSNVLEASVVAIMINQCLKCHDANGALSPLARVPTTGTPEKPFGTTIAGAAYTGVGVTANGVTGGVANVNESFKTTNSSYHPVSGKQNSSFTQGTRMVAPWSMTKTTGTSATWGFLISCWDCHSPPAATGVQTFTVTAHGVAAANYLRGTVTVSGTPSAANQVTLCAKCHAGYLGGTASSHGAGSALSSGTHPGMTSYINFGCNACHSSGYSAVVVRPIRAQDTHGVNVVAGAGTRSGRWSAGPDTRPYAFIRNLQQLANHEPLRIGATTYAPGCDMRTNPCSQGPEVYNVGGTY